MGFRDDQFWAEFLGIELADWTVPGVSIRSHAGLQGYRGLWCFRHAERTVVSAPTGWVSHLTRQLHDSSPSELLDGSFLEDLLGNDFEHLIGPAFQGCLDPLQFRHVENGNVRRLAPADASVHQFRADCNLEDWADSGLAKATGPLMGYFQDATLTALGGYRPWNAMAGDPCLLTHPDFRGRGYGTAVASAVVKQALDQGKLLLYQTLEANRGAVRIAFALGYEQYARHVAVRLKRESPTTTDVGVR
jgi:GNAT superfamily N-acetyltransferase